MNADKNTQRILGACMEVHNVLGAGFLEKVYHRALVHELRARGINARSEVRFPIAYKGLPLGEYVADLVVEDAVIVEIKCVEAFADEHVAQCINYLRASGLHVALLVNFQQPKLQWRRIVLGF